MRNIYLFIFMLVAFSFSVMPARADMVDLDGHAFAESIQLEYCSDEILGVRFLCNSNWEVRAEAGTIMIIISADPAVTMTVAKSYTPIATLSQLDEETLTELGQYAEGFSVERVTLAGREALKVKAFPIDYPQARLVDYYLLNDLDFYSLLFSIDPKEEWDKYKFLIQKIADSFYFIEKPLVPLIKE